MNMNQKYFCGEDKTFYQGQFHSLTETVSNTQSPASPPLTLLIFFHPFYNKKSQVLAQTAGHTKIHGHPQIPGARNSTA